MSLTSMRSIVLLLAMTLTAGVPRTSARQESMTIDWTVDAAITLHEPVVFRYVLSNASNAPSIVNMGYNRVGAFEFQLVAPSGRRQFARPTPKEGGSRSEEVAVGPREEYRQEAALDEWLQFSETGTYVLTIRFSGDAELASRSDAGAPKIQTSRIQVLPRDEARLAWTCARLVARARQCCTADSGAAIDELGYVRDPVAIPYLEALLAEARTSNYFEVLVEIGGADARLALQRLTMNRTDWVASNARAALQRIK